jgi:hypothetical protein
MRKLQASPNNQSEKQNIKQTGVLTKGAGFFCFKRSGLPAERDRRLEDRRS